MVEGVGAAIVGRLFMIGMLIILVGGGLLGGAGYMLGRYHEQQKTEAKIEAYKDSLITVQLDQAAALDSNTSKIRK
jgi:ABC-type phosphate transport system permease subunit